MSYPRLVLNSKGKLIVRQDRKKRGKRLKGEERNQKIMELQEKINDENYMKKAIEGIADILTEVLQ